MKKLFLALFLVGIIFTDRAFATEDLGGFYKLDNPSIPKAVADAAKKTYRVFFAIKTSDERSYFNLGTLEPAQNSANERIQARDFHFQTNSLNESVRLHDLAQIEDLGLSLCKNEESKKWEGQVDCPRFYVLGDCAAYATNEGRTLWTAGHCLSGTHERILGRWFERLQNPESSSRATILIFNSDGKLVGNPIQANTLKISSSSQTTNATLADVQVDYVSIAMDSPLPNSFIIGKAAAAGDMIFEVGHPDRTGPDSKYKNYQAYYARENGNDGQDGILMISTGHVIETKIAAETLGASKYPVVAFVATLPGNSFVTSADAIGGMSGGPILNEAGEVIGGMSAQITYWDKTKLANAFRTVSLGVRPLEW